MCPNNICTEVAAQQLDPLMTVAGNGLAFIGEMNRNDLIEEIMLAQRGWLAECSVEQLRQFVVTLRMQSVRKRLHAEAGITDDGYLRGWL